MKKIIAVLGVIALAVTFFCNTGITANTDTDLAKLISTSTASAEGTATVPCYDVEYSGGAIRARKCVPCVWDDVKATYQGICTVDY